MTAPVIYPAQGNITLLSRAWNLFRLNLKKCVLVLLPSVLLSTLIHLLSIQLAGGKVLTQVTMTELMQKLKLSLAIVGLSIPNCFLWVFCSCVISRYLYTAIIGNQPLPLKHCVRFVLKKWLVLGLLTLVLGLVFVVMLFITMVLFYLGIIFSGFLLAYIGTRLFHSVNTAVSAVTAIVVLLVWGFTMLSLMALLISFQTFLFVFPLMAIANAPDEQIPWWPLIRNSYRVVFANAPRLMGFALAQFFLALVIAAVIQSPVLIWAGIEYSRLGMSTPFTVPLHVQTVLNLWSTLASFVLMPFHISAFTLLWYDCQVRKEGLDLVLWFNSILQRQGRDPQTFSTQLVSQVSAESPPPSPTPQF